MVICCVKGCINRSDRGAKRGVSFFRFPAFNEGLDTKRRQLTSDRRALWLIRVNRSNAYGDARVCGDNFVSGKPADMTSATVSWSSQPMINNFFAGNIPLSAAVYLSGAVFTAGNTVCLERQTKESDWNVEAATTWSKGVFPRVSVCVRHHRHNLMLAKLTLVVFDHVCFHACVEHHRRRTRCQTRRSLPSLKIGSVSTTFALPLAAHLIYSWTSLAYINAYEALASGNTQNQNNVTMATLLCKQ